VSQFNTRHYIVPPANGLDYRIFNGYVYITPVAVPPDQIPARVPRFLELAGYYFQNWLACGRLVFLRLRLQYLLMSVMLAAKVSSTSLRWAIRSTRLRILHRVPHQATCF
jgi:hypothetical protein